MAAPTIVRDRIVHPRRVNNYLHAVRTKSLSSIGLLLFSIGGMVALTSIVTADLPGTTRATAAVGVFLLALPAVYLLGQAFGRAERNEQLLTRSMLPLRRVCPHQTNALPASAVWDAAALAAQFETLVADRDAGERTANEVAPWLAALRKEIEGLVTPVR